MRQKRRKRFPMTNKTKTSKTSKSNQTQPTANEEPHTTANVAEPGAPVASSKAASKKVTSQKKKAAQGCRKPLGKATKPAKSAKATAASHPRQSRKKTDTPEAPQNPRAPKPESKGAQLLALIGREQGASLTELRQASGWLAHSVRGFISTAGKKHNVKIASAKNAGGDRVYNILP
jgi:hypothetical protein